MFARRPTLQELNTRSIQDSSTLSKRREPRLVVYPPPLPPVKKELINILPQTEHVILCSASTVLRGRKLRDDLLARQRKREPQLVRLQEGKRPGRVIPA